MNPSQLMPNHLPDENYIQRLFPKCPPTNRNQFARSSSAQELQQASNRGSVSTNIRRSEQHRRARGPRVHQRSRRELEARRARVMPNNNNNNHNNNSNNNNNNNQRSIEQNKHNESPDSSDVDEQTNHRVGQLQANGPKTNNNHPSMHHLSIASTSGSGTSKSSLRRSTSHNFESSGQTTESVTLVGQVGVESSHQRSSKYRASRNLMQRIDRQSNNQANDSLETTIKQHPQTLQSKPRELEHYRHEAGHPFQLTNRSVPQNKTNSIEHRESRPALVSRPLRSTSVDSTDLSESFRSTAPESFNDTQTTVPPNHLLTGNSYPEDEPSRRSFEADKSFGQAKSKQPASAAFIGNAFFLANTENENPNLNQLIEHEIPGPRTLSRVLVEGKSRLKSDIRTEPKLAGGEDAEAAAFGGAAKSAPADSETSLASPLSTVADIQSCPKIDSLSLRNQVRIQNLSSETSSHGAKFNPAADTNNRDQCEANGRAHANDSRYINLFVYQQDQPKESSFQSNSKELVSIDEQPESPILKNRHPNRRTRTIRFSDETTDLIEENKRQQNTQTDSIEITILEDDDGRVEKTASDSGPSQDLDQITSQFEDTERSDDRSVPERVVSVLHQAGQELLVTETEDGFLIRNDASTEELCNSQETIDESAELTSTRPDTCCSDKTPNKTELYRETSELGLEKVDEQSTKDLQVDEVDGEKLKQTSSESMAANPHPRKVFVPPGYPQRISPPDNSKNSKQSVSVDNINGTSQFSASKNTNQKTIFKVLREGGEHVKHSDLELGTRESIHDSGDKHYSTPTSVATRRVEHQPLMPSIIEAQHESEVENVPRHSIEDSKSLPDINRLSLTDPNRDFTETTSDQNESLSQTFITNEQPQSSTSYLNDITTNRPSNNTGSNKIDPNQIQPNLRHHKIPNETNHYSIVRPSIGTNHEILPQTPSISSGIQFHTLSDAESGADDCSEETIQSLKAAKRNMSLANRFDATTSATSTANSRSNMPVPSAKFDDDLLPTAKSALIFPRLDEGLSSGAESCDDEVEDDDDERAIDADVDDDEDRVDILGVEDDLEYDGQSNERSSGPINESYFRPQTRSLSNLIDNQHLHANSSLSSQEQHQLKGSTPLYSGYISQGSLEQTDLKSSGNFPIQNGHSSFWMNSPGQTESISSQPTLGQHFGQRNQHSHVSNNFPPRAEGLCPAFTKNEVKSSNRLSSDTDNETDRLLGSQRNDQLKLSSRDNEHPGELQSVKQGHGQKEILIEGVTFLVRYLGETPSDADGRGDRDDRIAQAELAAHEVRSRVGDGGTEVQLFVSTERIMVLDEEERKVKLDQSLRTISYVANLNDAVVLIVRKKNNTNDANNGLGRFGPRTVCHVFESNESATITQSISQAFQVAYAELLKANGVADNNAYLPKELDYQEVLNSQEMSTEELEMFARKENQREVIVPKEKGEILGVSIVESGWGSVLPTVVIANLKHDGPAYRCKKLSIGDQILSVNGISLVGLPLTECQEILRKTKNQRVARLSVVPCPITVEVKIKRPDTKYQLGFSVQNGVICSLLRGGIAERGGVRVGHRIMSINGTTVVGVPHEKIVTLLASSVGEIRMKTCLTSLYRLILGEENPVHF